jgi:hypothetical protein
VERVERVGMGDEEKRPVNGREYLLLLRPTEESMKRLGEAGRGRDHKNLLSKDEILAVVEP